MISRHVFPTMPSPTHVIFKGLKFDAISSVAVVAALLVHAKSNQISSSPYSRTLLRLVFCRLLKLPRCTFMCFRCSWSIEEDVFYRWSLDIVHTASSFRQLSSLNCIVNALDANLAPSVETLLLFYAYGGILSSTHSFQSATMEERKTTIKLNWSISWSN